MLLGGRPSLLGWRPLLFVRKCLLQVSDCSDKPKTMPELCRPSHGHLSPSLRWGISADLKASAGLFDLSGDVFVTFVASCYY